MIITPQGRQQIYHTPKKGTALINNFACMLEISDERLTNVMLLGRAGFQESSNAVKLFLQTKGLNSERIQLNPKYKDTSRGPLQFLWVKGDTPFPTQVHTRACQY